MYRKIKEKVKEGRQKTEFHRYPLVLVVHFHIVPLPGDSGFWVAPWRDALHHCRLPCCHHHVTGGLSKIIPEN